MVVYRHPSIPKQSSSESLINIDHYKLTPTAIWCELLLLLQRVYNFLLRSRGYIGRVLLLRRVHLYLIFHFLFRVLFRFLFCVLCCIQVLVNHCLLYQLQQFWNIDNYERYLSGCCALIDLCKMC